jgi:hypothetical protein
MHIIQTAAGGSLLPSSEAGVNDNCIIGDVVAAFSVAHPASKIRQTTTMLTDVLLSRCSSWPVLERATPSATVILVVFGMHARLRAAAAAATNAHLQ